MRQLHYIIIIFFFCLQKKFIRKTRPLSKNIQLPTVSSVIAVSNTNIAINKTNISLSRTKVDFNRVNLDKLLKCSLASVGIASTISAYGSNHYPANPIAGSMVVNLFAIAGQIPNVETACW